MLRKVLSAALLVTLLSCSETPPGDLQHLQEVYVARSPNWRDSATEGHPKINALEDLGTVSGSSLRLVYFAFSWSLAVDSVHGTQKILIFRAPDLYRGEVYLNHPLDTTRTKLRGNTLHIVCQDGHASTLLLADDRDPEPSGQSCVGLFHPK